LQSIALHVKKALMVPESPKADRVLQAAWLLLAGVVFVMVVAIRIRLLGIPLERDEGEYAYAGQLLLQGIPPYQLAYNMKFPGTYAVYAVIMAIFGQTIAGIHLGLLLANLATITLIFLLGWRLFSVPAGVAAASAYAFFCMSPSVLGLAANAEHFVMLPVLGGTLLLLGKKCEATLQLGRYEGASCELAPQWLFASGLLFGIGLLMKQPAIFFIPFGAAYLLVSDLHLSLQWKRILVRNLIFWAGAILPLAVTCIVLWRAGVFDKFWLWTIGYTRQYGSLIPLNAAPGIFSETASKVIKSGWALWTLAGLGLFIGLWNTRTRKGTVFLLGLLAFSLLALSAGFYFRPHYYILILPAVSLFAGVAITTLSDLAASRGSLIRFAPLILFCSALSQPVLAARKFYFEVSPAEASRISYRPGNPFPESIRIAEYLRDHCGPAETIAVLGSEPQIYFYSKRHSATGYIYTYALMEPQSYARQMQQEMIREIELARPRYLVSVEVASSWLGLRSLKSENPILKWGNDYIRRHYDVVGLVNIVSPDQTDYYFEQMPNSLPQLGAHVWICRRKD
jgi:4-amino-4-deoxy-L-arabinose transferase-like glycosyltransferase